MKFEESETVELKSEVCDEIKKEVIAFANCRGGKIYIGVSDDGLPLGIENPDEESLKITNMVRDCIKPDVTMFLHHETLTVEGKRILKIEVQRGANRPYYLASKGLKPAGVFVREGFSSACTSDGVIRAMIKETDGDSFELERSLEQNLTFESAMDEFEKRDVSFDNLKKRTLGLISEEGLFTNLGLLLSDQCKHSVKVAVFQGCDQSVFKARDEFGGSLFDQLNKAYDFINLNNPIRSTFKGLYRVDERPYPEVAIRESLLNCLVHRDYSFSGSILISVYEDRIEFVSLGGLIKGLKVSDIMKGASECRNEKLANVFYHLDLIEAYGTGIGKIFGAYSSKPMKPKIETSDHVFKIILPNTFDPSTPSESSIDSSPVNAYEIELLSYLSSHDAITRKEAENLLSVGQTAAGNALRNLTERGVIYSMRRGRSIMYKPKKK